MDEELQSEKSPPHVHPRRHRRRRGRKRKRPRDEEVANDGGVIIDSKATSAAVGNDSDLDIPATVRALLGNGDDVMTLAEYARRHIAPDVELPRRILPGGGHDDGRAIRPTLEGRKDDGGPDSSKASARSAIDGGPVGSETGDDGGLPVGGQGGRIFSADGNDDDGDNDDDLYDHMRRIIVAPYRTPPPIPTTAATTTPVAAAPESESTDSPTTTGDEAGNGSGSVIPIPSFGLNVATRSSATGPGGNRRLQHRGSPPPPRCLEPLDALVDSVVSSLVHARRKGNWNGNSRDGGGSRRRRGGFFRGNNWGPDNDNVLSLGYRLASDARRSMRDTDVRSYCPNMTPGVVCVRPNSSVTYLKTSPLMRDVHSVLGDDALRYLLLNAVVLVPCGPRGNGNYFQLCGPPLSRLGRGVSLLGGSETTSGRSEGGSDSPGPGEAESCRPPPSRKKRRSEDDCTAANKKAKVATAADDDNAPRNFEEPWDANRPLPRHRIFYSQTFVKKVGLPPSHILNDDDAAEAEFPQRLLDSLVHLRVHDHGGHDNTGGTKAKLRRKRWRRLRGTGIDMCRKLRRRHARCDYARALERHCPLPDLILPENGERKDQKNGGGRRKRRRGCGGINDPTDDSISTIPASGDVPNRNDTGVVDSATSGDGAEDDKNMEGDSDKIASPSPPSLPDLVAAHTPAEHVASFLADVLGRAFPRDFWGSAENDGRNFAVVCEAVRSFILLRRHEDLPEKAIVDGIRVNDVEWLAGGGRGDDDDESEPRPKGKRRSRSASDHAASTTLVRHVMRWVFTRFVIPLIRSTFYVTEGEFAGKRTLYYRKPVWSAIRSRAMRYLVEETGHYRELRDQELDELVSLARNRRLGPSRLRLLPKKSGIRPIASMSRHGFYSLGVGGCDGVKHCASTDVGSSRKCNGGDSLLSTRGSAGIHELLRERFLSTNVMLRPTFAVLKYEQSRAPERLGCGIFGLDEVYPLYSKFLKDLEGKRRRLSSVEAGAPVDDRLRRSTNTSVDSSRPLYFVSADIHRCYDNINQNHLVELVRGLLSEDDYLIEKLTVLHPYKSKGWVERKVKRNVLPPECMKRFHGVAGDLSRRYTSSVFVDDLNCSVTTRDEIIELLKEHIFGHVVIAHGSRGPRFLIQSKGIPQGSILGTILCNFYYGDVESELLGNVFRCDEQSPAEHVHFLVRIVDDFLLISSDQEVARRFLHKIHEGIPHLGVQINKAKTLANFDFEIENNDGEVERVEKCGDLFPWCGLSFDTKTCEVSVDYSRFAGSKAADTLTVENKSKQGEFLRIRMKAFVRPRCQAILFDDFINRESVIESNFYQAMLFCAIKTIHYAANLEGGAQSNISYFVDCVEDVIAYSHNLIQARLRCMQARRMASDGAHCDGRGTVQHGLTCLTKFQAQWLGRHAFVSVLCKRMGDYQGVIEELQRRLSVMPYCPGSLERVAKLALEDFSINSFIRN